MIDWNNPKSMVSEYFSVKECLWLPHWERLTLDSELTDEHKSNLVRLCKSMDHIRDYFTVPVIVHCAFRPPDYSELVGGTKTDVHTRGLAMDFHLEGFEGSSGCDQVKTLLTPSLDALQMRLENNPGSDYVHMDIHTPGPSGRLFNP